MRHGEQLEKKNQHKNAAEGLHSNYFGLSPLLATIISERPNCNKAKNNNNKNTIYGTKAIENFEC